MKHLYHAEILANLRNIDMKHKKIVLFGANAAGLEVVDCLEMFDIAPFAVVDNDSNKHGKNYGKNAIQYPHEILVNYDKTVLVFIASKYYSEMKLQLESWGYKENMQIFQIAKIKDDFCVREISDEQLRQREIEVNKGYEFYQKILNKYGTDVKIHLAVVPSVGDIFLLSLYFLQYLNYNCINRYVMLIPGNAAADLAIWRGIKFVEKISKEEADNLTKLGMFLGFKTINLVLLHTGYIHTRIWSRLLTLKGLTWLDHIREYLLLPQEAKIITPLFPIVDELRLSAFFEENHLKAKQTVILAPYTKNVREIHSELWEKLALALLKMGYTVATNVGGENEKPISNTVPLSFPLKDAVQVLEFAGYFISMRSGLCDIAAFAKCKKIILYSDEIWDYISVFDFCSLVKMGLCSNVQEYVYDNGDSELIKKIMNVFE